MTPWSKDKPPPNYRPLWNGGTALWEIWYDHGPGTTARVVRSAYLDDVKVEANLGVGTAPHTFLYDNEAGDAAVRLARQFPDLRFAVKDKNW